MHSKQQINEIHTALMEAVRKVSIMCSFDRYDCAKYAIDDAMDKYSDFISDVQLAVANSDNKSGLLKFDGLIATLVHFSKSLSSATPVLHDGTHFDYAVSVFSTNEWEIKAFRLDDRKIDASKFINAFEAYSDFTISVLSKEFPIEFNIFSKSFYASVLIVDSECSTVKLICSHSPEYYLGHIIDALDSTRVE